MNRDWSIAIAKSSNAIVEAIAAEKISQWYGLQGKRVQVDWNKGSDIATKQEFDLIDTLGTKWEIKSDHIAVTTGRVFIEETWAVKSKADMALIFAAGQAHILSRSELIAIESIGDATGGDYQLARGHFISLEALKAASYIL